MVGVRLKRSWRRLSQREKSELFRRFKLGEGLSDIARALGRTPGGMHQALQRTGGYVPTSRKRSERELTADERDEIARSLAGGERPAAIARRLKRSPSTISREIARNGGPQAYRASKAEERAWSRGKRPKQCKLLTNRRLATFVASKLAKNWSPQQISGWLATNYPQTPEMNVSAETIYKTLFVQARGALKKELQSHLRRGASMRHPRKAKKQESKIPDLISIRDRPAEVEDRAVPGHWEGDLIAGFRNQSFIATLVERQTRFVKLVKIDKKDAASVAEALRREVLRLPAQLRRSITWDRGTEMARHKDFTLATDVQVFFCDPHSPWQRGSNENTNGLLRQYFPKGMVLSGLTQAQLDKVAKELNERPRMTLGWQTPAEQLSQLIATTG